MIIDEMWPNGPRFIRNEKVFSIGTDSILLSSFADTGGAKLACDLGCGSGVLAIMLAWSNNDLRFDAIDIQPDAVNIAKQNAELGGMSDRISLLTGDIRDHREIFTAGAYDLVVSNPPYFASGSGKSADDEGTAIARDERQCTLSDICEAAAYLTRWGGKFTIVHRPERTAEIICTASLCGLEPKRLRFVQHTAHSAPNLVLMECRRGGNPGIKIEAPLIMTNADGSDSTEIKEIYHRR